MDPPHILFTRRRSLQEGRGKNPITQNILITRPSPIDKNMAHKTFLDHTIDAVTTA